eukprot:gene2614-5108_t
MLGVVKLTVRSLILAHHRLGTSLKLRSDLLVSILGAPIAYFDITPLGRILNRVSSDIVAVDKSLLQSLSQLVNSVVTYLLYFLYDRVQRFFRRCNTEIQRLQIVLLSSIYADFSQTLVGVSKIRAYGQRLAIRLDLIGASISLFIAALLVGAGGDFILTAGYLALILPYSLNLTSCLKLFAVRMVATTEAQMNFVERVKFYAEDMEQEGVISSKWKSPLEDWPIKGVMDAMNVSLDGPLVFNNVSFTADSN